MTYPLLRSGSVGAACAWRTPGGWTGRRFHLDLGNNKEVFDAEVYAIYQALSIMDQRQETSQRYTIFADSAAAIERVRSDAIVPGQRFAVAAIEVGTRLVSRGNEVAIHWVPAPWGPGQRDRRRDGQGRGRGQPPQRCSTGRAQVGDQPVSHGKGGNGEPLMGDGGVDLEPHW